MGMSLQEKLKREVNAYAEENGLLITKMDFLYAGPTMRSRHSLILAFTDAGIFTFVFRLNEAEMHYLQKDTIKQVLLEKKTAGLSIDFASRKRRRPNRRSDISSKQNRAGKEMA